MQTGKKKKPTKQTEKATKNKTKTKVKCLHVEAFYELFLLEDNAQGQHIWAKVNASEE